MAAAAAAAAAGSNAIAVEEDEKDEDDRRGMDDGAESVLWAGASCRLRFFCSFFFSFLISFPFLSPALLLLLLLLLLPPGDRLRRVEPGLQPLHVHDPGAGDHNRHRLLGEKRERCHGPCPAQRLV